MLTLRHFLRCSLCVSACMRIISLFGFLYFIVKPSDRGRELLQWSIKGNNIISLRGSFIINNDNITERCHIDLIPAGGVRESAHDSCLLII